MHKQTSVFQDINQDIISKTAEIMNDDNVSREDNVSLAVNGYDYKHYMAILQ